MYQIFNYKWIKHINVKHKNVKYKNKNLNICITLGERESFLRQSIKKTINIFDYLKLKICIAKDNINKIKSDRMGKLFFTCLTKS